MTGIVTLPSDQEASGRSLGEAELAALAAVIGSGTLTSTKGSAVAALEAAFAAELGVGHAIPPQVLPERLARGVHPVHDRRGTERGFRH